MPHRTRADGCLSVGNQVASQARHCVVRCNTIGWRHRIAGVVPRISPSRIELPAIFRGSIGQVVRDPI